MTTTKHQQVRGTRLKRETQGILFQTQSPTTRNDHFDSIFQQFKKESAQAAKNCKNQENQPQIGTNLEVPKHQQKFHKSKSPGTKNHHLDPDIDSQGRCTRAKSSNKFDCLTHHSGHRKNKKLIQHIFEMVKKQSDQKEGSSKKSTDNSNSSQIQKIMAENKKMEEKIRMQQRKAGQLEKQIHDEIKKHELQKQLYEHNIEKLKKKVANQESPYLKRIQELQQSLNNQQQFDRLSIDSH